MFDIENHKKNILEVVYGNKKNKLKTNGIN